MAIVPYYLGLSPLHQVTHKLSYGQGAQFEKVLSGQIVFGVVKHDVAADVPGSRQSVLTGTGHGGRAGGS